MEQILRNGYAKYIYTATETEVTDHLFYQKKKTITLFFKPKQDFHSKLYQQWNYCYGIFSNKLIFLREKFAKIMISTGCTKS